MRASRLPISLLAFVMLLILSGCQPAPALATATASPSAATALPSATPPSPSSTLDSRPARTPQLTPFPPLPTSTPASYVFTAVPNTLEPYAARKTQAWQVWQTVPTASSRTPVPIPEDSSFLKDLKKLGYFEYYGSSTTGPAGYTYSAYIFLDSTFWYGEGTPAIPWPYPTTTWREARATPGCRIVFYRSDENTHELLYSFPAARYPEQAYYAGYPVSCLPNIWNSPSLSDQTGSALPFIPDGFQELKLDGPWSDINQNGLPEFSVLYQYCASACAGQGAPSLHFYEIQTTSKVVDITAGLPGIIQPYAPFVHSIDPLEVIVFDPSLWFCYKWCALETGWIYAWDGSRFVDVTPQYADEIRETGRAIIAAIQNRYGQPVEVWELYEILFLYEKAGLSDTALDLFLEISDPAHWPSEDDYFLCELQYARAAAQAAYRQGSPFDFPQNMGYEGPPIEFLHQYLVRLDPNEYDLSACQALLPAQTPAP